MKLKSLKFPFLFALANLLFVAVGIREETRSYSCHLYRNTFQHREVRFLWIPLSSSNKKLFEYPIPKGHTHNWLRFARYKAVGYKGWLGASVACRDTMYRDGKRPGVHFPKPTLKN